MNRVDGKGQIYVLTSDGFEIPVQEKELVFAGNFTEDITTKETTSEKVYASHEKQENKLKKQVSVTPVIRQVPFDAPVNLVLGFIAENEGPVFTSRLLCYLINDSACFCYYSIGTREKGIFGTISSGILEPETKFMVKIFEQTEISRISDFHLQAIWVSGGKYSPRRPVDELISIHSINFTKDSYFHENEYFDEDALIINITGRVFASMENAVTVPEDVLNLKKKADQPAIIKKTKKSIETDILEVDLHAGALDINDNEYDAGKILDLQMKKFHEAIVEALNLKMKKLVIIHGMGQGKLKTQIRKELQDKYPKYMFQDASFKEYGFGATMIYL